MLVDHSDPEIIGNVGIRDVHLFTPHADLTLFRLIESEQHVHQRGLTGSIFTKKRMNFTLFELESNIVVSYDAWELLADIQHLDYIIHFIHSLR